MAHEKSRKTTVRFRPADDDALDAVAAALGLDRSTAVRFLVMEKARALGLEPRPPASVTLESRLAGEALAKRIGLPRPLPARKKARR